MGLFGKHTKSGELGSMAQSLAKFAGGAVFAKEEEPSPYGPSGGLVEGGEGAEQGLTMMDRLGSGWRAMTDLGDKEKTSAATEKLHQEALALKEEREAKNKPWEVAPLALEIDPTGVLGDDLKEMIELEGWNTDGGHFTQAEFDANAEKRGFFGSLARVVVARQKPLQDIMNTQEQQIKKILVNKGYGEEGKITGEKMGEIMQNPSVHEDAPEAIKKYNALKANQAAYKKSIRTSTAWERREKLNTPPTTDQMERNAYQLGINRYLELNPNASIPEAIMAVVGKNITPIKAAFAKLGYPFPRTIADLDKVRALGDGEVLEGIGAEAFDDEDTADDTVIYNVIAAEIKRMDQLTQPGPGTSKTPMGPGLVEWSDAEFERQKAALAQ